LEKGTTQNYCEQFFDIRHCLKARDYLINVVIRLHATRLTREDGERFIRLFGLMAGRFLVDALLDYYANPIPQLSDFEGAGEEEQSQLRRRLEVHVAIQLRCAREDSANLILFSLLMQKLDRHPREQLSALISRIPELHALMPDASLKRNKRKQSLVSKAA
jgi:hypothetical protein